MALVSMPSPSSTLINNAIFYVAKYNCVLYICSNKKNIMISVQNLPNDEDRENWNLYIDICVTALFQ